MMQRVCFLLRVKEDRLQEYKEAHTKVWPEMREALTRHGWHNYSLFLAEDGLLVGYVETPDFKAACDGMQSEAVNTRWQAAMQDFFVGLDRGTPDSSLLRLEHIFHLP